MKTYRIFAFTLAAMLMINGQADAASGRAGTIVDLQPIENRGDDESGKTKKGRMIGGKLGSVLGGLVGSRMVGSDNKVVSVAGGSTMSGGEAIGSELAAKAVGPGATTRFMVKVKLDTGKTLTVTQFSQQIEGLKIGSRVRVEGKGDDALIFAE